MPMRSYKVEAVRERASEGGAHLEVVQTLASRTSMGVLAAGRVIRRRPSRKSRRLVMGETSSSWQTVAHVVNASHQPEVNQ